MTARDLALSAAYQARKAAALEAAHEEALRMDAERTKDETARKDYEAALPILAEWFPGVEWTYARSGDYGYDTIVWDASEATPAFLLYVHRRMLDMNEPSAGYRVHIEVGDYVPATGDAVGHSYFRGRPVKGAADVGRYLLENTP